MSDGFDRLIEGLRQHGQRNFAARPTFRALTVASVQSDGLAIKSVSGAVDDGGAELVVPMRGKAAAAGDRILVMYDPLAPAGAQLQYVQHIDGNHPGAGLVVVDADLPIPTFPAGWHSSSIVASPGSITARASVYFNAVADKYGPAGYILSHRYTDGGGVPTEWRDSNFIPHIGGVQECSLGSDFPPGATIDVKIRASYTYAAAWSIASLARSFTAATDNATPGNATGLNVGVGTPGTLILQALGSVDAALFKGWRYEIATGATGPLTQTSSPLPGEWTPQGLAPGVYYVAVRPVSNSGTFGGRFPVANYQGPYTVSGAFAPDVTPPSAWAAPVLSIARNQPATGGEVALLTVTLPAGYGYPADYKQTIVRFGNAGAGAYFERTIAPGQASIQEIVPFGTTTVTLQGEDTSGNRGTASPSASATLAPSGVPGAAPVVVASKFALAIKLDWNAVPLALNYEVERAPNVGGSPGTYARIATVDARMYLDTLTSETVVLPNYWYRVRAVNLAGSGPYSTAQLGTAGAVDAANLRLQSVTANQIAANAIAANHIQAGVIDASKLVADLILSGNIRTAMTGSRVEILGGASNVLNIVERIGAADYLRMTLAGPGLTFYNNNGTWALRTGQSGDVGYLESAGGFRIRGDSTALDLSNRQYMSWAYSQFDGLSTTFQHEAYLTRIRQSGNVSVGIGLLGLSKVNGGPPYGSLRFIVGDSLDPFNATNNMPTAYVQLSGGSVYATDSLIAVGGVYLGASGKALRWNAAQAAYDLDAPIRSVTAHGTGQAVKLHHDGTDARMEWSAGQLFLGVLGNPGNYVAAGNGAGNYGRMGASAFNVLSSATQKRDIRDLPSMGDALRKFRPRRFKRVGARATEGEEFGFVAEEVEALAPNAVVTMPGLPTREATEDDPDPPTGTALKGLNPLALLAAITRGVQDYMTETDATLVELRVELAAIKQALKGA